MSVYRFDEVIERLRVRTEIEVLNSCDEPKALVADRDVHRPGMALMGYTSGFLSERVQVFGESEVGYLASIPESEQRPAIQRVFDLNVPGALFSRGLEVPAVLLELARDFQVPVVRASVSSGELVPMVQDVLDDLFAPRDSVHGTLADVYGVGLLVTGRSGIGKSETVLDLVERGHRLVADDLVMVTRRSDDILVGTSHPTLRHHMEIRGVGIVDVLPVFGVRAFRVQKRIEVEVRLEEWEDGNNYDRHGLDRAESEILGVKIPRVVVPIVPGKNITVITEVIALDFMLKTYGIDSAEDLNRRIIETMAESGHTSQYLKHDFE